MCCCSRMAASSLSAPGSRRFSPRYCAMSMASKFISDARWAASRCWCRFGAARRRVERMANAPILLDVLIVEAALGYTRAWAERGVHPVIWLGRLIGVVDTQLNRGRCRRSRGLAALALVFGLGILGG